MTEYLKRRNAKVLSYRHLERTGKRASSIKLAINFTRKSMRKSVGILGTTKARSSKATEDDDIDDSWDYGNGNVHFLELISRQMIKENSHDRPISPANDELKQQIRMLNEKMSLTPNAGKVFEFRSSKLPIIKISPAGDLLQLPKSHGKSDCGQLPDINFMKTPLKKSSSIKELKPELTRSVLSSKSSRTLIKKNYR